MRVIEAIAWCIFGIVLFILVFKYALCVLGSIALLYILIKVFDTGNGDTQIPLWR